MDADDNENALIGGYWAYSEDSFVERKPLGNGGFP